ncbi:MAG: orotidine-5'-phosphate decarboxylase [Methanomethylovorans sp.]|jgi:orotidine-5'-phosphate decarboxylase|nr:orotidine-5'-phosphate decarboxylase [Methanomethylovorans sp.]
MIKDTRLILALDVTDRQQALRIAQNVKGHVDAIKIGYPLVLATGKDIIAEIADMISVIADFKVADIPNTNRLICEQVFRAGADAVIVHGFTGSDSLRTCVEVAEEHGGEVYVVIEMSHPGALDFMQRVAEDMAQMAANAKVSGVIAPATRPERVKKIRSIIGDDIAIISPGVGVQGGSAADAIRAGADWVIVGRSIYKADDPRQAAINIEKEIKDALK